MEATVVSSVAVSPSFGQRNFGGCDLCDVRLTARAVKSADLFHKHPGGPLPDKLIDNADLVGFYRLVNNSKVTHAKLIAGHCARTRELIARATGVVLVIHDTTEIDFSGLSVQDLGPIGHGGCSGYLCHNSLAYDYAKHEVLGLAHQTLHVRRKVPKGESRTAKREHPDRESRLWKKGFLALGPAPQKVMRVNVADRGADLLEFIEAVEDGGDSYVIRSKSNRNVEVQDDNGGTIPTRLHDLARTLPSLGVRNVAVAAHGGHKARSARASVAAARVSIRPPHHARGEHSRQNLVTFVVCVREIQPPPGAAALEWILLTNVPAGDLAQACERVDWYARRPVIEEYHKAQKTGCGIELVQFTTGPALRATIAILSVVAIGLLRLRDLSRQDDAAHRPAAEAVDPEYVHAVSLWRYRQARPDLSIHDFFMALAKLGGHLNRRHDHPPGWLVLWRGWTKMQLLVLGARAARHERCV
jgi:hypothetical protein